MNMTMLGGLAMSMHNQNRTIRRMNSRSRDRSSSDKSIGMYSDSRYVMEVIKDDDVLTKFFEIIENESNRIDDIDAEKVRKSVQEKLKIQAERVEKIEALEQEIRDSGLDIESFPENLIIIGAYASKTDKEPFGKKGEYALARRYFSLMYNKTILEGDWFTPENRQINPFEKEYNEWIEKYDNIDKQIRNTYKQYKRAERQYNSFIMINRGEKGKISKEAWEQYQYLLEEEEKGKNLKVKKEDLDQITLEQKEKIYEIYKITKECEVTGKEIDLENELYLLIKGNSDKYNRLLSIDEADSKRRKWPRVLENLKQRGEITEEMMDAVDSIISELGLEYRKYSGEYEDYEENYYDDSDSSFYKVVSGYLKERRENIVSKSHKRKETAYDLLKPITEKKLGKEEEQTEKTDKIEETNNKKGIQDIEDKE